ncbi:MFS transporter [Nonomuraea sp. NPDC002799]
MPHAGTLSAWAPLRRPAFRALWMAQFVANVGTWAQTVGAQWLMGDLGGGTLAVALVQTAGTLPVFLLVVPSGALGDILDRRRLLLTGQALMCAGAAGLAVLTAVRMVTPWSLLLLIGLMSIGQALSVPSFQAIQPELVSREEIPRAAMLNGANANVARAVGPALGGALIAVIGPAATFAFNTLSFLGVLLVLYQWNRPPDHRPLGTEHVLGAASAGWRYIRHAPMFTAVLTRSALFTLFAAALWALLPVIARENLRLSANGYGLLLGSVGVGAVAGAFVMPRVNDKAGPTAVVNMAMAVYAVAMTVAGVAHSTVLVSVALVVIGLTWIAVQSTLSAAAQILLPAWTRARALAYFQLVFMGGQALGAVAWGAIANANLSTAFLIAGAGLLLATAISVVTLPLPERRLDMTTVQHWPEPAPVRFHSDAGPVLVSVDWHVPPPNAEEFVHVMHQVRRSRKRTGANLWGLYQDVDDPTLFVETFTIATWHEHLRQHLERGTVSDRELEERAHRLLVTGTGPRVRHLIWAESVCSRPERNAQQFGHGLWRRVLGDRRVS